MASSNVSGEHNRRENLRKKVKGSNNCSEPDCDGLHLLELVNPPLLNFLLERIRPRVQLESLNVTESLSGVIHPPVFPLHNLLLHFFKDQANDEVAHKCQNEHAYTGEEAEAQNVKEHGE